MQLPKTLVLLDIYPREMKMCSHKNLYTNVYRSLIHNSPSPNQEPRFPSTGEWCHRVWSVLTMKYYSATKRKKRL